MIGPFDEVETLLKLYSTKLKRQLENNVSLDNLKMSVMMQKRKKIHLDEKMYKLKVVKARRLRIKIIQVFNHIFSQPKFHRFEKKGDVKKITFSRMPRSMSDVSLKNHKQKNSLNQQQFKGKIFLKKNNQMQNCNSPKKDSIQRFNSLKVNKFQNKNQQAGGMINLFEKFTEQQLNELESDELYYFGNSDLIQLFRKYLSKKRSNSKDYSYENFMLKSPKSRLSPINLEKMSTNQVKNHILSTIAHQNSFSVDNQVHLLTNPQSKDHKQVSNPQHCKSLHYKSLHYSAPNFNEFKVRQLSNRQDLKNYQETKKHQHSLDVNYRAGVVNEKRGVNMDNKRKLVLDKNILHHQKSVSYRSRIQNLSQTYGKSIQMAQAMRSQFLKKIVKLKKGS